MTTELGPALLAAACALWLSSTLASGCGSGSGLDAATLPVSMQRPYRIFASRCSRCHSLSRPLNARITSMHQWELYVSRMRRMPGSGINRADSEQILVFLGYYMERDQDSSEDDLDAAEDEGEEPASAPTLDAADPTTPAEASVRLDGGVAASSSEDGPPPAVESPVDSDGDDR